MINNLSLVQAVDRLGQRVAVRVVPAADRSLVITPFLADAKSRDHAAASMCFGGKPPLALLGRS